MCAFVCPSDVLIIHDSSVVLALLINKSSHVIIYKFKLVQ